MEDFFEIFRMNVKFYREKAGLSQSQLAIGADCTNGMIGQIEAGISKPSFDRVIAIAKALHIHPADLFLRNASVTVTHTKSILKNELLSQIEEFIDKQF
ncbi:MAG: helix-turn-helix transcriptional regulator [Treponema sp.]|nr:helix-turn-helix transcriptional regulator [Treponema sp.]